MPADASLRRERFVARAVAVSETRIVDGHKARLGSGALTVDRGGEVADGPSPLLVHHRGGPDRQPESSVRNKPVVPATAQAVPPACRNPYARLLGKPVRDELTQCPRSSDG